MLVGTIVVGTMIVGAMIVGAMIVGVGAMIVAAMIVGTMVVGAMIVGAMRKPLGDKLLSLERDVAQWLERGALPMSLSAVRFRIPLGAGFSDKYHVSPLSILRHHFDSVSLCNALYPHMLRLTQV